MEVAQRCIKKTAAEGISRERILFQALILFAGAPLAPLFVHSFCTLKGRLLEDDDRQKVCPSLRSLPPSFMFRVVGRSGPPN